MSGPHFTVWQRRDVVTTPAFEDTGHVAAIATRRRRKCIAEDAHTSPGTCPRCGLTEGTL